MGGSESKTTLEVLTKQISNIAMNVSQSCEVQSDQKQKLNVKNTGLRLWGDYRLEQKTDIQQSCFTDTKKETDLQNQIIQAISQASTSSNVALLGAFGKSESKAETKLRNIIKSKVTMSNIQSAYSSIRQRQSANFSNSGIIGFERADLVQGSQLFAAATLQVMDQAGIFNTIDNHIQQTSAATQENPLDFIPKSLAALSSWLMYVIIFIVIVAVAVLVLFIPNKPEQDVQ